jgi:hypothetical protein
MAPPAICGMMVEIVPGASPPVDRAERRRSRNRQVRENAGLVIMVSELPCAW